MTLDCMHCQDCVSLRVHPTRRAFSGSQGGRSSLTPTCLPQAARASSVLAGSRPSAAKRSPNLRIELPSDPADTEDQAPLPAAASSAGGDAAQKVATGAAAAGPAVAAEESAGRGQPLVPGLPVAGLLNLSEEGEAALVPNTPRFEDNFAAEAAAMFGAWGDADTAVLARRLSMAGALPPSMAVAEGGGLLAVPEGPAISDGPVGDLPAGQAEQVVALMAQQAGMIKVRRSILREWCRCR